MLHTHHSPHHFTHLLALTLALVGLMGGLTLPSASAGQPSPRDCTDQAHSAHLTGPPAAVSSLTPPEEATQARVREAYGKLPLSFEANQGQTEPQVQFLARGRGYSMFLMSQEAVLIFSQPAGHHTALGAVAAHSAVEARATTPPQAVLRMTLVGANSAPPVIGQDALPGKSHYLIGNDPQQWRTDIAHYAKVKYEGVYPGVDLLYYGNQGQLEYDFVVSAGADPHAITLAFAGASAMRLGADGELVLSVGGSEMRQRKPVIYQEVDGVRQEIAGGYRLEGHHVSFAVGEYDVSRPLVIDPVLVYATYLGGSGGDGGSGIAVDKDGQAYVTGGTGSLNFPTTAGAFQPAPTGGSDAFVTQVNRSGSALVYATYLGGSGGDGGRGIAVDKDGQAYVTGQTSSPNFPTTAGAFQPAHAGGFSDTFVTKLSRNGSALVYSTYLGGSSADIGQGIAVDEDGRAYVAGGTLSADFPTTPSAFQPANAGSNDAFVAKIGGDDDDGDDDDDDNDNND